MSRLPDAEVERIKTEVSLQRLVEARGIELRRHGADLLGLCPFHDDHDPSLVISPAKNLWHCMGACGAGGSVIDWVMRTDGLSFRHALEVLRDGRAEVGTGGAPRRASVRKLSPPVEATAADAELLGQVVAYYHATLTTSPEALAYLGRRRIDHAEAIDRFRLGYANRTLGYRLPERNRKDGAELRGRLIGLGVLRASGHEHFAGSVVVPVSDEAGVVTELYGRKLRDDLRAGTPAHLYLPGPHRGVWNPQALAASAEVILCESLLDALTFWCAGFRHVTAAYGTEGFTADHAAAFARHQVARVLIAYDRDAAGDRAAAALAGELMASGVECFRVLFPHGADANDVACAAASPTEVLGRAIRGAEWMGAGRRPPLGRAEPVAPPPGPPPEAPVSADAPLPDGPPPAEVPTPPTPDLSSFAAPPPAAAPLAASPVPALPAAPAAQLVGEELRLVLGERRWRVRGLGRITSLDTLRLNVAVARTGAGGEDRFHVDTFDLYSARARAMFTKAAADECGLAEDVVRADLGRVLLAAEAHADEAVRAALAPPETAVAMSAAEEAAAMALLRDPDLIGRICADVERTGVVGEATNALVAYLVAVSRKLDSPLAVIVQSTSAAGKSALMEAVLAMVPPEDAVRYSAMTGQSLYYMGEGDLAHKVLAVAEEEGAERASYALKLLQSEGELSIASTGKDPATGRLVTHAYRVAGPVAIMLTTTAAEVDEELANRAVVLAVDEDRAQTRAIHDRQRAAQTLEGLLAGAERERILKVHHDAQRLLVPLAVVNPWAPRLGFTDGRTRTRRDHPKYLTLIRAIALLHQHQRPRRSVTHAGRTMSYIEATLDDVALANRLAHEILGRSLDELAPQARRLLGLLDGLVGDLAGAQGVARADVRFTRRAVREHVGWSEFQVRTHLERLVGMEYVLVHRGGRGQSFVYELLHDGGGADGRPHLSGLVDVEALRPTATTGRFEGPEPHFEGPTSPQRGPVEAGSCHAENTVPPGPLPAGEAIAAQTARLGSNGSGSHVRSGGR